MEAVMNEARPLTRADAVGALRSSLHLLTGTKTQRRAAALIEVLEAEPCPAATILYWLIL